MKMFDFECSRCGRAFEQLVADDASDAQCPHCGSIRVRKVLATAPALGRPRYQAKAIMANGQKIDGHFGKTAPIDRLKKQKRQKL